MWVIDINNQICGCLQSRRIHEDNIDTYSQVPGPAIIKYRPIAKNVSMAICPSNMVGYDAGTRVDETKRVPTYSTNTRK